MPAAFRAKCLSSLRPPKTYWVLVHGFGSASGSFVLSATCTPPDPLPLPCGTTTGDTSSPPAQVYNFPDCPVPITEPGILYELAPITPAQSVTLTTCNGGTLFDTIISVYSPGLQCYTGNDDTGSSLCSTVTFNIDQANTYTILVHGVSTGQFELTVLCSPNPLECTCRHGTPAEGTNCISGGELCESCDTGFVLTEGTCKPWCVTVDYLDYALLGKRGKSDVRDCWKARSLKHLFSFSWLQIANSTTIRRKNHDNTSTSNIANNCNCYSSKSKTDVHNTCSCNVPLQSIDLDRANTGNWLVRSIYEH